MTTTSTAGARELANPERRGDGFLHRTINVGEVRLHVAEARPEGIASDRPVPDEVPLVVFLHGFPEFWWSWRKQLRAFAEAGYWAIAPDLRGFNESEKPKGVSAYEVERLAGDVAGMLRALGRKKAIVVGHDWGAVVAWFVAQLHPEMVERLAILNVPHPLQMTRGLRRPAQLLKSWYMFFFQLPRIPERLTARNDFAFVRKTFAADGIPAEDIEHYVDAARVPGALTGAMNYYRAAIRRVVMGRVPKTIRIDVPVLVIWGDEDRYLGKEMAEPPERWVTNARVVHIPGASHWVQSVASARVNELLLGFAAERRRH
ncbi:Epoxide hydrolase [Labilithrix luteola]|uniref:Epoxide hydrolase n=1 Tax=Labilithrix luteola TaxID=1391654 RepID=A0A0K1QGQ9_9BACT|nr:alpha/beta hydrolase [Labilithrix luteola]AKV04620.1 Epoxide hydrolase [Labilithrix luteola]